MPSAISLTPDNRFFALFVGEPGSGKTVAEGSFVEAGGVNFEDFDGRIRGLLGASWIDRTNISYNYYPPRVQLGRVALTGDPNYIQLNNNLEVLQMQIRDGQSKVKTEVVDSLTSETFALLCDAVPITHEGAKGKRLGQMHMAGPEDYGFEATGTYNLLAALRAIPIPNVIVSAHYVDRFGKKDPDNPFSESIVMGKKLSVRDKIGTNVQVYFDHVFEFRREVNKFYVKFRGELARTSYAGLPDGEVDITGKSFYQVLMNYVKKG